VRLILLAAAVLSVAAGPAKQLPQTTKAEDKEKVVSLGEIDSEADDKLTNVNVRLEQKPAWTSVGEIQDHGSFLQVVLPDVLVPESGKFIEAQSPYIKKIAVFQLNQKDAGVRFFVSADAALTKQATSVALLDKRVVLTIDHAKLKSLLPPTVVDAKAPAASAEAVIAKTEVDTSITAPSDLVKKDAKPAANGPDLREKLTNAAIFSGAMLMLLALALAAKPYLRRRAAAAAGTTEAQVSMKTLASMPIAARQRLQLVQIGDERILIGVSADSINYITTVGKQAYASSQPAPMQMPMQLPVQQLPRTFGKMIEDAQAAEAIEMRRPVLKNIEGNDEASLRQPPAPKLPPARTKPAPEAPKKAAEKPAPKARPTPPRGGRLNVSVGEDGVKDLNRPAADDPQGIDDVTRLIREKLKTLRTI
jgi:flagellar protein FliO/FliZ